ncbi:uncharacterized protein [Salminus brasiliensis]|uniref:uncharacterized protein isoform X1 n=1 Tax=Salminus brasiliensis TaxID=930266 RepID=UPI003B82C788
MQRIEPLKYKIILSGETKNAHVDFVRRLCEHRPRMQEVLTVKECDVILAFCPVVSRAGTDIEAALMILDQYAANKPVVLVVLYHTFDPESIVPDSSRCVNRANTFTVDCLFHEDRQLLKCSNNDRAIAKVTSHLGSQMFSASAITRREYDDDDDDDDERQPLHSHNTRRDAEEDYSNTSSCCDVCCCGMFSAPAITRREYDDEERQPLFSHNTRRDAEEEHCCTPAVCCCWWGQWEEL